MSNVVRLNNGGAIQVRTGVLAGIGPQGARGAVGPSGPTGEQGPKGDQGEIGQILQMSMRANVSANQTVASNTDVLLAFGTVSHDDMSAAVSSTNFRLSDLGDYLLSAWVKFELPGNAGEGSRQLWFNSSASGLVARASYTGITDEVTYANLTFPHRCTSTNEVITVYARSGDDLPVNVTAGSFSLVRTGSGPQGPVGPQGPQGGFGPQGPAGPQGPDGNANSGYATYADLL